MSLRLLTFLALSLSAVTAAAAERPNVVLIVADDKYDWREDDGRCTTLKPEKLCIFSADSVSFRAATAAANSAESMTIAVD